MMTITLLALLLQDAAPAVKEAKDLAYFEGEGADPRKHKLDLYLPVGKEKVPVVMWIHGGAWKSGDRALYGGLGRKFAEAGFGFAAISYRLSPAVKHPEHVKDCARAFAWLHANVAKHGGDPDRLFVMGHSAGGHLSALLTVDPKLLEELKVPAGAIKAAVPMSGVYFIPALREEARGPMKILVDAFGSDPETCRGASPTAHIKNLKVPMLVVTETNDTLKVRPSMKLLQAAVEKEGVKGVEFVDAEERDHISIVMRMAGKEDPIRDRIVEFLRGRLKELDATQ